MKRTQDIKASTKNQKAALKAVNGLGNPGISETITLKLDEMPTGSWFLKATTDTPLELLAQTTVLDPETLEVQASFANHAPFPVTITGFVVDQE